MGDKKNAVRKLQLASKSIKLNPSLDLKEINLGSPKEYLRLYHYLFLDYSPIIASEILNKHNMELSSKNDKLFIDGIYKLVRDMFSYVPKLTKDQFFQTSFAQIKALMAAEIIEQVQEKLKALNPSSSSSSATAGITASSTVQRPVNSQNSIKVLNPLSKEIQENNENIDTISSQEKETHANRKPSFKSISTNSSSQIGINKHMTKQPVKVNPREQGVLKEHQINVNEIQVCVTNETEIETNDSRTLNSFENILTNLAEKILNLTSKFDCLVSRVENIEKILDENRTLPGLDKDFSNDMVKLNKTIENLTNRVTILETGILSVKQNSYRDMENDITVNQDDQNDSTTYETPFHSFVNSFIQDDSSQPKKSGIVQGLPYEIQTIIADNLNDLSINSTDSTPTISQTIRESKFANETDDESRDASIQRAKELVNRASHLNQILSTNLNA